MGISDIGCHKETSSFNRMSIKLEDMPEHPVKDKLIYLGHIIAPGVHIEMLDNGIEAKFTLGIPTRKPQGRVTISKEAYSN